MLRVTMLVDRSGWVFVGIGHLQTTWGSNTAHIYTDGRQFGVQLRISKKKSKISPIDMQSEFYPEALKMSKGGRVLKQLDASV